MNVDSRNFLEDIKQLKAARVIVLDREITEATGVTKGNLSSYLKGRLKPSTNFLKKFYEVYGKHLLSTSENKPDEEITAKYIASLEEQVSLQKKYIILLERERDSKQ